MTAELLALAIMLAIGFAPLILSNARVAPRRRRARRAARVLGGPIPPLHVRVVPDANVSRWVERRAREFERHGFERLGAFRVDGTSLRLIALSGDDGTLVAEVKRGTLGGNAVDVTRTSIEGGITFASTHRPFSERPPWHRHLPTRGDSVADLVATVRADVATDAPLVVTRANFVDVSEREHRRMNEWILRFGGLRPEMIAGLERLTGESVDPKSAELLRHVHADAGVYPRE